MSVQNFEVLSIGIHAAPHKVFDFVADQKNDSQWSIGFSEVGEDFAIMETPNGNIKVGMKTYSNSELMTVDTVMTFPDGSIGKAFSRVIENDNGKSAIYLFVLMAPPVPLEELEGTLQEQKEQLAQELKLLKTILEN